MRCCPPRVLPAAKLAGGWCQTSQTPGLSQEEGPCGDHLCPLATPQSCLESLCAGVTVGPHGGRWEDGRQRPAEHTHSSASVHFQAGV